MAYLTCFFDDDLIAHFHVNWLAPVKVRQTMICGTERMVVFDDIEMSEKIKVYDKGLILDEGGEAVLPTARRLPHRRHVGAAHRQRRGAPHRGRHFVDCIRTGATPRTDGQAGLRVVQILEAATTSLEQRGQPVDLAAIWTPAGNSSGASVSSRCRTQRTSSPASAAARAVRGATNPDADTSHQVHRAIGGPS